MIFHENLFHAFQILQRERRTDKTEREADMTMKKRHIFEIFFANIPKIICWNLKGMRWISIFCTNPVQILATGFVIKGIRVRRDCTAAVDAPFYFPSYRIFWLNPTYWKCLILLLSLFNPLLSFACLFEVSLHCYSSPFPVSVYQKPAEPSGLRFCVTLHVILNFITSSLLRRSF